MEISGGLWLQAGMETEPELRALAYDRIHHATAAGDGSKYALKVFWTARRTVRREIPSPGSIPQAACLCRQGCKPAPGN
jgi:hypothetical protein